MFGLDSLQQRLEEMEKEQSSPSSEIKRNPLRVLTDMLYFFNRSMFIDVERVPETLTLVRRFSEIIAYITPIRVEGGETYRGPEVAQLANVRIPTGLTWQGRWSIFPTPGSGMPRAQRLNAIIRNPTHYLSLVPTNNGEYRFHCQGA